MMYGHVTYTVITSYLLAFDDTDNNPNDLSYHFLLITF